MQLTMPTESSESLLKSFVFSFTYTVPAIKDIHWASQQMNKLMLGKTRFSVSSIILDESLTE